MIGKRLTTLALAASISLIPTTALAQGNGTDGQKPLDINQHQKQLQRFKQWSNDKFNVVWAEQGEIPTFVSGVLSKRTVRELSEIKHFLKENQKVFHLDPKSDLKLSHEVEDQLGMTHYQFVQSLKGIPIAGARFTVHTNDKGKVTTVTGNVHPKVRENLKGDLSPNLSKQQAIQKAWEKIGLSPEKTQGVPKQSDLKNKTESANLVVYPYKGNSYLAYHVQLRFIYPKPGNWQIFINANNGSVIQTYNAVMDDGPTTGYGYDIFGNKRTLHTFYTKNTYYLTDTTKPMKGYIETFTARNGKSLPGVNVMDNNDAFTAQNQKAGVSAQYNVGQVYDYYYNTFGRNSYDDNGAILRSTVHYGTNYNNAFWNGVQMVYGDGDGSTFIPLAGSLEVTAHELTHAVTQSTAGLEYHDQPGALNESISDTFAYFVNPNNFLMGEAVYTPNRSGDALRSLKNPSKFGQPENMSDYVYTSRDNGGVHINSGIPNKAAYLTIQSLGKDKAEQIYYRALTTYLSPQSQFSDARAALLQAAADLYGYNSEYKAVANAWDEVGVY
ncbi:MAG TPA: M4 family metallopeptidase [Bacillales bacterium]|nr:M4 family metallopeptidase [Bacillales bacterium]